MKALNLFFIGLFIFSAAVQYNDPDPYVWMPIYLYGAVLCYFALKRKYNLYLHLAGFAVYISYGIYLFQDSTGVKSWLFEHNAESLTQTMQATKPWIEESREFFGLMLLNVALLSNTIWLARAKEKVAQGAME
jgi:hypothetical protein